jgi:hypothetical protein
MLFQIVRSFIITLYLTLVMTIGTYARAEESSFTPDQRMKSYINLSYNHQEIASVRLESIQNLDSFNLMKFQRSALLRISKTDRDSRVREEAKRAYEGKPTLSIIKKIEKEMLKIIGNYSRFNYRAKLDIINELFKINPYETQERELSKLSIGELSDEDLEFLIRLREMHPREMIKKKIVDYYLTHEFLAERVDGILRNRESIAQLPRQATVKLNFPIMGYNSRNSWGENYMALRSLSVYRMTEVHVKFLESIKDVEKDSHILEHIEKLLSNYSKGANHHLRLKSCAGIMKRFLTMLSNSYDGDIM